MEMTIDTLGVRVKNCEEKIEVLDDNLKGLSANQREILNLTHQNELTLSEIKILQRSTQEDVKELFHDAKNLKLEMEIERKQRDKEIMWVKEKLLVHDTIEETKSYTFKQWHLFVSLSIGAFGAVLSIYDRLIQHLT